MTEVDTAATDGKLEGRVVLITGGRRVGGELALLLAARGARVAMTFHTSRAKVEHTVAQVAASGQKGMAVAADLRIVEQAEDAVVRSSIASAGLTPSSIWPACSALHRSKRSLHATLMP